MNKLSSLSALWMLAGTQGFPSLSPLYLAARPDASPYGYSQSDSYQPTGEAPQKYGDQYPTSPSDDDDPFVDDSEGSQRRKPLRKRLSRNSSPQSNDPSNPSNSEEKSMFSQESNSLEPNPFSEEGGPSGDNKAMDDSDPFTNDSFSDGTDSLDSTLSLEESTSPEKKKYPGNIRKKKKVTPPSPKIIDRLVKDSDIFDGTSRVLGTAIKMSPGATDMGSSPLSGGISCKDILLTTVPVPQDPDVNLVMQTTYTFCLIELVLQQYIAHQKRSKKIDKEVLAEAQKALKQVQEILPLFLLGYLATMDSFMAQGLRETLNQKRVEATSQ